MKLNLICYGEDVVVNIGKDEALDIACAKAVKNAGIAERYQQLDRWELRTSDGVFLERHLSPSALRLGEGARIFLSPKVGFSG